MSRIRNIVVVGLVGTAVAIGCTVNETGGRASDGTVEVTGTHASALVTGHVEGTVTGSVDVSVNGQQRTVTIAPDRTFVVRDVPEGDCTFAIAAGGVRGSLTIDAVQPGEVIEVSVRIDGNTVVITIVRRNGSSAPPREVTDRGGAPLEITANHVCYFLQPGVYDRDIVIRGHHVSLLGNASCTSGERSVLNGTLRIAGHHVLVHDVELRGSVLVSGHHNRIEDSCSRCFADQCIANAGGGSTCGAACQGAIGEPCSADNPCSGGCTSDCGSSSGGGGRPGVPVTDAGTPSADGGSSLDAGADGADGADAATDGGTTSDAGAL